MSHLTLSDKRRHMAAQLLKQRYRRETLFRLSGAIAVGFAVLCLCALLFSLVKEGASGLRQSYFHLQVPLPADRFYDANGQITAESIHAAPYRTLLREALQHHLPPAPDVSAQRQLSQLLSLGAARQLRQQIQADTSLIGQVVEGEFLATDDVDMFMKYGVDTSLPDAYQKLTPQQQQWLQHLQQQETLSLHFNTGFFRHADSREPEQAGMLGGLVGSLILMAVCVLFAFPVGVMAAIYLEEFAPQNRLTDIIEVNINNLAAVPSIIFGLLGLVVYLQFFGMPRSSALVGGLTLALMTLPTIIIATRAALRAVPSSIRDAARGLGASPLQVILHHTLPLAMPGIMTGTILGLARAIGETAPLLMIGMVAFVADVPSSPTDPAVALPVQIYNWADSPEQAYRERTSLAILVLLAVLACMNTLAVIIRQRFEHKW